MRLYLDEHVPSAITAGLRCRDVDVLTVQEDGLQGSADPILFDRAIELDRLIYSQDKDFLAEARQRQHNSQLFPGVIHCRQLALSIGRRVVDLETIAKYGDPDTFANRVTYLPLR